MSSGSSSSGAVAAALPADVEAPRPAGLAPANSMRLSLCCCLALEKSGTYSKMMLELSRPYHLAGEPHMRRMRYLSSMTRASKPGMSVSGEMTLRSRQNRKSPTLECSR